MTPNTGNEPDEPRRGDYAARSRATRQHVLDTTVELLAELGYAGTSTLKIQQRAGVSRGRLLHQYRHRDELLVAAVQHIAEARIADVSATASWPSEPRERVRAAIATMWETYQQGYFWASTELWLAARHQPALLTALAPHEQALGLAIRNAMDRMFGPDLAARPRFAALSELLNSSMRGVALTYAFAPRDPNSDPHLDTWVDVAFRELDV